MIVNDETTLVRGIVITRAVPRLVGHGEARNLTPRERKRERGHVICRA